jgi:hypothetical protein
MDFIAKVRIFLERTLVRGVDRNQTGLAELGVANGEDSGA